MKKKIALILSALMLITSFTSCKINVSKNKEKNQSDNSVVLGSSIHNIENGGLICYYKDWIFYADMTNNGYLCAYNNTDKNMWKITDFPVANISVTDNLLVFTGIEDSYFIRNDGKSAIMEKVLDYSSLTDFLNQCQDGEKPVLGGSYYAVSGMKSFFSDPSKADLSTTNITSENSGFFSPVLFDDYLIFRTVPDSKGKSQSTPNKSTKLILKPVANNSAVEIEKSITTLSARKNTSFLSGETKRITKENGYYYLNIIKTDSNGALKGPPVYSKTIGKTDWEGLNPVSNGSIPGYAVVEENGYIYMENQTKDGSSSSIAIFRAEDLRNSKGKSMTPIAIIPDAWNLMVINKKLYYSGTKGNNIYRISHIAPLSPTLCDELPYMKHKQNKDGSWDYTYEGAYVERNYRLQKDSKGFWRWLEYRKDESGLLKWRDAPYMDLPSQQQHENDLLKSPKKNQLVLNEDQYIYENMWTSEDIERMIKETEKEWKDKDSKPDIDSKNDPESSATDSKILMPVDPSAGDAIIRGELKDMLFSANVTSYEFIKASSKQFSRYNADDILTQSKTFENQKVFEFHIFDFKLKKEKDGNHDYSITIYKSGGINKSNELEKIPNSVLFGIKGYFYLVPTKEENMKYREYGSDLSFDKGTLKFSWKYESDTGEVAKEEYELQFYLDGDKLKAKGKGCFYIDGLFKVNYDIASIDKSDSVFAN